MEFEPCILIPLQPLPKTYFPPYGPIPGRERARGTNPGRAREKPQDGGVPRESGGQGEGAAGDKKWPRADHGPARLLGSISALTVTYAVDNMPELHTRSVMRCGVRPCAAHAPEKS